MVGFPAPTTTGATRCGFGPVTMSASGVGTIKWFDSSSGGNLLATGNSFTPTVASTTTFYAAAVSNGGGSGTTPLPPETNTFASNARGYWFTAPSNFTLTGLYVLNPANGSTQNIAVVRFNPAVPPPVFSATTNAFTTLFLTQNNTTTGPITVNIPINAGDVIGVLGTRDFTDVNSYTTGTATTTINGQPVTLTRMGMQFPLATLAPQDLWTEVGGSISRVEMTYEVGCESPRTASIATVTFADPVTTTALPPALCQGNASLITATSNNANYNYTWSPATGLSSTTGASVTASPSAPTTYIVIGDDGTCANVDTVFMDVGPASNSGTATESVDTICSGNSAILNVAGTVGNIQWQGNTGAGWVNETGTGNTAATYIVSPTLNTLYRAVVTSGGCDPDTSLVLPVAVLNVASPTVNDTTICANSTVTLTATGAGAIAWYNSPLGGPIVSSGNTLTANVIGDTTFYAAEKGGSSLQVGPLNNSIGNSAQSANDGYGLGFNVTRLCVLEKVYVYPTQSGTLTVNLRNVQGGTILKTRTLAITASASKTPVALGWTLNPGTNFRLEIATGSVPLKYNYSGTISYPYTTSNGPLSITGFLNPFLSTTTQYFYFYDWDVFEGCYSSLVPLNVTTTPAQPVISQSGALLTSSASSGNQWYLNGSIITGATSQTYLANQTGLYSVHVTIGSCTAIGSLNVTFIGIDELKGSGIAVYPNPVADLLTIDFDKSAKNNFDLRLINASGAVVFQENQINNVSHFTIDTKSFAAGLYLLELKNNDNIYRKTLVKN